MTTEPGVETAPTYARILRGYGPLVVLIVLFALMAVLLPTTPARPRPPCRWAPSTRRDR
jgi:hypothetical protein